MDVQPGQTSGGYLFQEPIGRGSFGVVYRGVQVTTQRPVALKVLAAEWMADQIAVARFVQEARVTASLRSPHTVTVYDAGRLADGSLFIAMELLDGSSLRTVLEKDGPLELDRTVRILGHVCDSLAEAHARGLIHRDLKPENVILEEQLGRGEVAKVVDFGIAKVLTSAVLPSTRITAPGFTCGTPHYMSPEQCEVGQQVGPRSDLYALGVMAFEMITGRVPFAFEDVKDVFEAHILSAAPRLSEVIGQGPVADLIEPVIARCLEKDPKLRYQSADEVAHDLAHRVGEIASAPSLSLEREAAPPRRASRMRDGDQLGEYTLLRRLGQGGFGSVWLARDERWSEEVAIKVLHPKYCGPPSGSTRGPTIADRFLEEARILLRLRNPGIVEVRDVIEDRSHATIAYVMEKLVGRDLTALAMQLDLPALLEVFARACDTLDFLHQSGVLHRDIKPSNIFVCDPPRPGDTDRAVKLIDFGVAKDQWARSVAESTATGMFVGSLETMAPECFKRLSGDDVELTGAVDQWGIGVALYHCLTGRPPFRAKAFLPLMSAIESKPAPPLKLMDRFGMTEVPPGVARVIARLLAKNPDHRYSAATAAAAALRGAADEMTGPRSVRRPFSKLAMPSLVFDAEMLHSADSGAGDIDTSKEHRSPIVGAEEEQTLHSADSAGGDIDTAKDHFGPLEDSEEDDAGRTERWSRREIDAGIHGARPSVVISDPAEQLVQPPPAPVPPPPRERPGAQPSGLPRIEIESAPPPRPASVLERGPMSAAPPPPAPHAVEPPRNEGVSVPLHVVLLIVASTVTLAFYLGWLFRGH